MGSVRVVLLVVLVLATALAACAGCRAGSACVDPGDGELLLTNEEHGYCLLYPEGHTVERPNPAETVLVVGSLLNTRDPRLHVEVSDAGGRKASDAADAIEADARAAIPDWALTRNEVTLDGETGVVLGPLPGQELNRRLVVVHDGRLYDLWFMPADASLGAPYEGMEALYDLVLASWRFTGQ